MYPFIVFNILLQSGKKPGEVKLCREISLRIIEADPSGEIAIFKNIRFRFAERADVRRIRTSTKEKSGTLAGAVPSYIVNTNFVIFRNRN